MPIDRHAPDADAQLEQLLAAMTREEKLRLVHGDGVFTVAGVERLGIPPLVLSDGPHGVRQEMRYDDFVPLGSVDDRTTYLPTGIALGATWNRDCATAFGDVLGAEARARGKDVILGPGVNLIRTPLCGRNFEYVGEDPYHVGQLGIKVIAAIQRHDVAADVKHFAGNNQELNRNGVDAVIDDRTLRELYLPAFEGAVREAGCLTVMGAYNKLNGTHCCHHAWLLQDLLKDEWGFAGFVVSDWGGVHDADEAARPGLDLEMGGKREQMYLNKPFAAGLADGSYPAAWLDEKVRRVLRVMLRIGALGDPADRATGSRLTTEHAAVTRHIAAESLVLLQNDGLLPLAPEGLKRVLIVGNNADRQHAGGGGSSGIRALEEITPLNGLRHTLSADVDIQVMSDFAIASDGAVPIPEDCLAVADHAGIRGWQFTIFANRSEEGEPVSTGVAAVPTIAPDSCPAGDLPTGDWMARWTGTITAAETGTFRLVVSGGDFFELRIDGTVHANVWDLTEATTEVISCAWTAGEQHDIELRYRPKFLAQGIDFGWITPSAEVEVGDPFAEAEQAASDADVVIVIGGSSHRQDTEGIDRPTMDLPGGQNELISRVAAANPRTAVVLFGGSAVELPWLSEVPAVLQVWYPGQEGGHAIADALLGVTEPMGRLPFSWPARLADAAAHAHGCYGPDQVRYDEGLAHGYRWHDGAGPAPLFPFGHGLSYTTWAYDDLRVDAADPTAITVTVTVNNTGDRAGAEVVQLYLACDDSPVPRPPKTLVGFEKVHLEAGASATVRFTINERARSHWDTATKNWMAPVGTYRAIIGRDSQTLVAEADFIIS